MRRTYEYINCDRFPIITLSSTKPKGEKGDTSATTTQYIMFSKSAALFLAALLMASLIFSVEGTYRKPPFNGSIFGKRGATIDYDGAGKALSAMCEIANEACQAWFPNQEKK